METVRAKAGVLYMLHVLLHDASCGLKIEKISCKRKLKENQINGNTW